MRVFLNEYNIALGKGCYLPLSTGLLRAYAETIPDIKDEYSFAPFLYKKDTVESIISEYRRDPDWPQVAAFSVSVWNEQLCLQVAEWVKSWTPDCLIVFGGAQVPHNPTEYFKKYPFVDVTIRGEGEESFADVLLRNLESRDFADIPQVAYRKDGNIIVNPQERKFKKDLDSLPSPYLAGLYDEMMQMHFAGEVEFQAIIETNRGCPFLCTFCFYGSNQHKFKYHGKDKVLAEIEWLGQNKIAYTLGADSNFGMQHRDIDIAKALVETKRTYGYPEKFRVNFGKNAGERIYEIGLLFNEAELGKGITLARQSNDEQVLANVKRSNIKLSTYSELQAKFNEKNILVYSEFIVGLPGETVESWKRGLDEAIMAGMRNQFLIYPCMALPNTEMGDPGYQKKHGYDVRRVELAEIHGAVRSANQVREWQDLVVGTNSMSIADWRYTMAWSFLFQALHGMRLGYFYMMYLANDYGIKPSQVVDAVMDCAPFGGFWWNEIRHYRSVIDSALSKGDPIVDVLPEWGNIYWTLDEGTFLRSQESIAASEEMLAIAKKAFEVPYLRNVQWYTDMRTPSYYSKYEEMHWCIGDIDKYFNLALTPSAVKFEDGDKSQVVYRVKRRRFDTREQFAREVVLKGRLSGTLLECVKYYGE